MLFLLAGFALSSGFSTAIRADSIDSWVTPADYPRAALRAEEQGYVGYRLEIAPDGKPSRCEVMLSSGSQILDQVTCPLLLQRARFRAIKDSEGQPTAGVFRSILPWTVPTSLAATKLRRPSDIDLDLSVNALPSEVKGPAIVNVQAMVDASGHVTACTPDWGDGLAALGKIACQQISAQWHPAPGHDANGVAVRSVQVARVRFTVGTLASE